MAGILLVTGLALFVVTTLYLVREAGDKDGAPAAFLLPFFSLPWVREHWHEVCWPALGRLTGGALMLLGAGMLVVKDPQVLEQPDRVFSTPQREALAGSRRVDLTSYVSAEEAIRVAIREDQNPALSGRIQGRDFVYDRVQLVDGVLSMRQGRGFIPELEVRILFPEDPLPITQRQSFFVRPGDEDPPEVYLSWKEPGRDFPETLIVSGGYRMEMQLAPLDRERLTGFIQLILPDAERSFLSGDFNAHTSNLHYRADGRVDIGHDHPQTLEHVTREYLERRFSAGSISDISFSGTRMDSIRGYGTTRARIELDGDRVEERTMVLDRADIGWVVRPGATRTRVVRSGGEQHKADEASAGTVEEAGTINFDELEAYLGERVTVMRHEGDSRSGVIRRLGQENLYLETVVGDSRLEFQVARDELAALVLDDGKQLVLEATARSIEEREKELASEQAHEPSERVMEEVRNYEELEGSNVRIHTIEGRTRSGRLTEVRDDLLTLEVRVGAGSMEYFFRPDEIESLEAE